MIYTQTDIINAQIVKNATSGATKEQFIMQVIREFEASPEYQEMVQGRLYFENKNPPVVNKRRMVISANGLLMEDTTLSNNQIAHPFMRKLTRQKVNYLLSKPFSIETDDKEMLAAVQPYVGKKFLRLLKNTGYGAIKEGIHWLRPYYDQDGNLQFMRALGLQVIPLWTDLDHTIMDAVIYTFFVEVYEGQNRKTVRKVEYHDADGVSYYTADGISGALIPDIERTDTSVFTIDDKPYMWERHPFIPFRYNPDEISLLRYIKGMIDSYDWVVSTVADLLDDIPALIYVLKSVGNVDLSEFRQNMMQYKAVKVSADGDLTTLNPQINIDAVEKHLERLYKDIFDAGDGVDTQSLNTSNISTDTFRMLYNGLDMDCQSMGTEFAASLNDVFWFIFFDIRLKTGKDFFDTEYEVVWNTDIAVNESETIDNIVKLKGIVSDELLDEQNPWVKNPAAEQARRRAQEKREQSGGFGFPNEKADEGDDS